ncbi:MAG: hypothetical protein LBJ90_05590 [Treponema sp.]|jgi:hypothetical protein|nr:hypothetical protein [Treponema sp.]
MNEKTFCSLESWKSAIVTLPDASFFELMRSVFGNIKTPFNKQRLMEDLAAFLSREEIQKILAAYIDEKDARIIAAVSLLGNPFSGEMESFFSGEINYAELHDILLNLEERFILFRFTDEGLSRLALNPILEPILSPLAANKELLLPSFPRDAAPVPFSGALPAGARKSFPDDRVLAGLLSFVSGNKVFFKTEGGFRKRIIDLGKQVFPGLEPETLIGGLLALGLFRIDGDKLFPDYRRFSGFGRLTPRERMEYWAAGICCFRGEAQSPGAVSSYLYRNRIRAFSVFIHSFLDMLSPSRVYPLDSLRRLAVVLERNPGREAGQDKFDKALLLEVLEKTGLLESSSPEYLRPGSLIQDIARNETPDSAADTPGAAGPVLAPDASLSFIVYPEIAYEDALGLAAMLDIREAGAAVRFELTRDSAVRGFDRGIPAAAMLELLRRLSGGRIDESLAWTLKDWENRYGEVSFHKGFVLRLSEERRYLAETGPLAGLIKETLAPGVYLLPETAEDEAAEALQKAGVDIIARRGENAGAGRPRAGGGTEGKAGGNGKPAREFAGSAAFPPLSSLLPAPPPKVPAPASAPPPRVPAADSAPAALPSVHLSPGAGEALEPNSIKQRFHSILKEMKIDKAERDELAARIERRLVLVETQLKNASIRYEKLEARGLDYVGKALIAKQAIAMKSPLEVIWAQPGKSADRFFGIPLTLEKEGGESILVINPFGAGGSTEKDMRIPLGKISFLRRIKKSIFENIS